MNLVWKQPASAPSAGMMHCISTTMASTAPVATASSCCRKLPATGTPWRMSTSFPVQHMPATLIPVSPFLFGQLDKLRVGGCGHYHLREQGFMSVNYDIDLVRLQNAQISF